MTTKPIALLDTSTVILVANPPGGPATARRKVWAEAVVNELLGAGIILRTTATVLAELGAREPAANILQRALVASDVEPFDDPAGHVAAVMHEAELARLRRDDPEQVQGSNKDAVKFDTLLAAKAHEMGARYLITANKRDFVKMLQHINSPTIHIQADREAGLTALRRHLSEAALKPLKPDPSQPSLALVSKVEPDDEDQPEPEEGSGS